MFMFIYVTDIICFGCDDNPKGLCQAGGGRVRGRGWSAGWGGAHKGGAAAVYKMLITPTTKALVVFWKRPRKAGEPKWFTKGPRQFTIVYRTFDRLPPPGFHQLCV